MSAVQFRVVFVAFVFAFRQLSANSTSKPLFCSCSKYFCSKYPETMGTAIASGRRRLCPSVCEQGSEQSRPSAHPLKNEETQNLSPEVLLSLAVQITQ